ncbi:MAG: 4-hydroxy-tetrahydrodipicolinate reductase [Bacteroidia bacterium]
MNIALIGYGKMGREIEKIALSRGHQIVLKVDEHNASSYSDAELKQAHAAIEFSTPATAVDNILRCFRCNVPVVAGTTGWLEKMDEVKQACTLSGSTFFYASNYSIGVNLFFQLNKFLAQLMNPYSDYNPVLEEIHHIHKKDSPSGTGITLAEDLLSGFKRKTSWKEGESTDPEVLAILSKREGEVPGTHNIHYISAVDEISISHIAHNRKGFALGAVIASEWIQGKKGIWGMNDMLGFREVQK